MNQQDTKTLMNQFTRAIQKVGGIQDDLGHGRHTVSGFNFHRDSHHFAVAFGPLLDPPMTVGPLVIFTGRVLA